MTDSFEIRDDSFADAGFDVDNNNDGNEGANVLETSLDAIAPEPNGFVKLGLAKDPHSDQSIPCRRGDNCKGQSIV